MNKLFFKYIALSILTICINEFFKIILDIKEVTQIQLNNVYTVEQVNDFFEFQKKWEWTSFIVLPLLILIKTTVITSIIFASIFFSDLNIKVNAILNLVLKVEFIFLLVPIFKIIWFYFFQTNYTLEDIQNFYPLSALNIIGYKGLETWFIYPFQVLNLFEFFYIIYLGFEIGKLTHTNTDYGLKIVGISYIPALVLWVATVMFFTLNYS